MYGLAQKLHLEKFGPLPKSIAFNPRSAQWQELEKMVKTGQLPYIDYVLAESILSKYPTATEGIATLICHLSISANQGHLCISVDEEQVLPDPCQTWGETNPQLMMATDSIEGSETQQDRYQALQKVTSLIKQGAIDIKKAAPLNQIICFNNLFYLQKYWFYETLFLKNLQTLANASVTIKIDKTQVHAKIDLLQAQKQLLPEQAEGIISACQHSLSIICGGPGTGKTYTAGLLIKVYWESLTAEQRTRCEIALAAPTGKAAANLQKSLSKWTENLDDFRPIKAKTLHSLLGIQTTPTHQETALNTLSADLILVDESSMIDVRLMAHLLASIKPGARLILLGDPYQLPPVEAGSLFSDLITYFTSEKHFGVEKQTNRQAITLKTCLRVELRSIIDFAETIHCGDSEAALQLLSNSKNTTGIKWLTTDLFDSKQKGDQNQIQKTQKQLIHYIAPFFPSSTPSETTQKQLLDSFNGCRLLSPLRKGPFGVEAWNHLFLTHFTKTAQNNEWFIAPIILVSNDYRQELFNGEVGVLVKRRHHHSEDQAIQKGDYALFPNKTEETSEENIRKIPALLLPKYEYAYCLSIHKSQGSEFDHVILTIPEGSETFGREILYTAVTRARKQLDVWGDRNTLQKTINRKSNRLSGIAKRL